MQAGIFVECFSGVISVKCYSQLLSIEEGGKGGGVLTLTTCTYVGSIADKFDELCLLSPMLVRYPVYRAL